MDKLAEKQIMKEANDKLLCKGELGEVGRWKDKCLESKGGHVFRSVPDVSGIIKSCGCYMGMKCNCE